MQARIPRADSPRGNAAPSSGRTVDRSALRAVLRSARPSRRRAASASHRANVALPCSGDQRAQALEQQRRVLQEVAVLRLEQRDALRHAACARRSSRRRACARATHRAAAPRRCACSPTRRRPGGGDRGRRAAREARIRIFSATAAVVPGTSPSSEPRCCAMRSRSSVCAPASASAASSRLLPEPVGAAENPEAVTCRLDREPRDDVAPVGAITAVELDGAPSDLVQHVRERRGCAGRRASSRPAASTRVAVSANARLEHFRDVARDQRRAEPPRFERRGGVHDADPRTLVVAEHRMIARTRNVIVGEFGRAADVDAVGVAPRCASTPTRGCPGRARRSCGLGRQQRRERGPDVVEHLCLRGRQSDGCGRAGTSRRLRRIPRTGTAPARPCARGRRRRRSRRSARRRPRRSSGERACRSAARASRRFCAAAIIASRFARIASRLPPRNPSLPPSSMIVIAGRCCASSAPSRARPPAVVSPLMLALTTR